MLETIYDEEQVHLKADITREEFDEWVENLDDTQLSKIKDFVDSIPDVSHSLVFPCTHCKEENRRLLEGLHNFFRLGDDS